MSSIIHNPDWFTSKEMSTWLSDIRFPYTSVEQMLQYVRLRWPDAFKQIVLIDKQLPQSYAHWWCHCRVNYSQNKQASPQYNTIAKWEQTGKEQTTIISDILVWLDMLYIDIAMLPDEMHREGVPRLYENQILVSKGGPKQRHSRRETVVYLINAGHDIFKERGFTQGLQWWEEQCQFISHL